MQLTTLKLLDSLIPFSEATLRNFLSELTADLKNGNKITDTITSEVALTAFSGMDLDQLLEVATLASAQNIQNDVDFDKVAARLKLVSTYKESLKNYNSYDTFNELYKETFVKYIDYGLKKKLLHSDMGNSYLNEEIEELANELDHRLDDSFDFIGLETVIKRYTKFDWDQSSLETPQYMWMRIAMWMAIKETNKVEWAKTFYRKLSKLQYIPGGSTNIGAGTTYPTLSNCYLIDTEDDTTAIFDNVKNIALISKATGGIGISVTKLRASGSLVKSNNTFSTGPIPFIKVMDTTLKSMSRAGKKHGAMCIYMENWHYDFGEFLDLKQNAGDDYRRVRTADTAVYISDEFMKRVENDQDWYLFDPAETPDLPELYGTDFSKRYIEYCKMADQGKIKLFKKMSAREQMKTILNLLISTSHPWLTWKDTINLRALNNNTGTIHSSNLCTEICLPQDRENIAVCNLAYINLDAHVKTKKLDKVDMDWNELKESVRVAMRHLDNLVDVNILTVPEAKKSDAENRAVGLGMSGLAEVFEKFGYPYDSEEAYDLTDKITEFISYYSIETSADLAQEKGSYKNYKGSMWSKGFVPFDTISLLEKSRKEIDRLNGKVQIPTTLKQNRSSSLDWSILSKKVSKGIRNATVMAIAPNASTGLVLGTSPGIDVRFSQIFSRATSRGKYLDINRNLVNDLQKLNLWDNLKDKIIQNYGDISNIEEIPQHIRDVYKTSFQVSPYGVIEVASRAQKWIDQSLSRNMYLETREVDDLVDIYTEAWRRGLKTTYYLHTKPRHTSEQSNTQVNKSADIRKSGFSNVAKKGFAAVAKDKNTVSQTEQAIEVSLVKEIVAENQELEVRDSVSISSTLFKPVIACPVDPAERALCEACQ